MLRLTEARLLPRDGMREAHVRRHREDVILPDGTKRRVEKSVILGPVNELKTKKNAQHAFDPFLARVLGGLPAGKIRKARGVRQCMGKGSAAARKTVERQSREIASAGLYPSVACGDTDGRVHRAGPTDFCSLSREVSRKTVQSIMGTLASMLKTAKAPGYDAEGYDLLLAVLNDEGKAQKVAGFEDMDRPP